MVLIWNASFHIGRSEVPTFEDQRMKGPWTAGRHSVSRASSARTSASNNSNTFRRYSVGIFSFPLDGNVGSLVFAWRKTPNKWCTSAYGIPGHTNYIPGHQSGDRRTSESIIYVHTKKGLTSRVLQLTYHHPRSRLSNLLDFACLFGLKPRCILVSLSSSFALPGTYSRGSIKHLSPRDEDLVVWSSEKPLPISHMPSEASEADFDIELWVAHLTMVASRTMYCQHEDDTNRLFADWLRRRLVIPLLDGELAIPGIVEGCNE
ncbi:hypothetical protein BKA70DRAFT_1406892 [Coprinopsis sp. MPI-PUGE-AT-0042]|nr:hypothetical protein BKA70DRAFT_1406892 [Coprinopsis sp. MPI-PUGE-AT-0042]